jgi:hypothetical protein
MEQVYQTNLSETYRLMIYFAHSTLTIYQKTIVCTESMSVNDFRNKNEKVVQRVFDECKSIFNYELSYEQMNRAIRIYFICKFRPQSVLECDVFKVESNNN